MLNEIGKRVCERADEFFDELGVSFHRSGTKYVGPCPVHGGDGVENFNLYPTGYEVHGYWVCRSHLCHTHFVPSLVGFTRGVLSHDRYGWDGGACLKQVPHVQAVDYCLKFLNIAINEIEYDEEREEKRRFAKEVEDLVAPPPTARRHLGNRRQFRNGLIIPAPYYLARGYSPAILHAYDVGHCINSNSDMNGRAVVPIYDLDHRKVVGCVGRSIYPQCPTCQMYHSTTGCPESRSDSVKWKCSHRFNDKHYLYNYWRAKDEIRRSQCVIVVEGPGDVWRLVEAGIANSVALMGSDLTDPQHQLLNDCGANYILVATDGDAAGEKAAKHIFERCGSLANVRRIILPAKDVGDMEEQAVRHLFLPYLQQYSKGKG